MTRSHRRWFITDIWKSDHRLNITFSTHIKLTLSFLSAKLLCWWKWILSYFKTQKQSSEDNLNTNGRGLSGDVDSAVLSVSHTSVTSTLLSNSCWTASFCLRFMPPKSPAPLPKLKLTRVRMREFSARMYTLENRGFKTPQYSHGGTQAHRR